MRRRFRGDWSRCQVARATAPAARSGAAAPQRKRARHRGVGPKHRTSGSPIASRPCRLWSTTTGGRDGVRAVRRRSLPRPAQQLTFPAVDPVPRGHPSNALCVRPAVRVSPRPRRAWPPHNRCPTPARRRSALPTSARRATLAPMPCGSTTTGSKRAGQLWRCRPPRKPRPAARVRMHGPAERRQEQRVHDTGDDDKS